MFLDLSSFSASVKRDLLSLCNLAKDAWEFDRLQASFLIAETVFFSVSRCIHTAIDALLATHSIRLLQHDKTFSLSCFGKLALMRLLLSALHYNVSKLHGKHRQSMRAIICRKRTLKLVETYLRLPYSQQMKESVRGRFKDVLWATEYNSSIFEDVIRVICQLAETGLLLACTTSMLLKTSRATALGLILLTFLYAGNAVRNVQKAPENHLSRWKSKAERRMASLSEFPFESSEAAQDLRIYGSSDWLLKELEKEAESIPLRKEDTSSAEGITTIIDIFEAIGIPVMMALFGLNIDLDAYTIAQKSFAIVTANLSEVKSMTEELYKTALPFSRKYIECISLLSANPLPTLNTSDAIAQVKQIRLENVSFSYDDVLVSGNESKYVSSVEATLEKSDHHTTDKAAAYALDGISFCFEEGKVYSIVGKNGSGKSTLVNILGKLYKPTEGQISVNGIHFGKIPEQLWTRKLVMMAQQQSFMWNATFGDNISFGLPKDQVSVLQNEVDLCGVIDFIALDTFWGDKEQSLSLPGVESESWVTNMSDGQWQSVALARAFCRKGSGNVFILDEPSAALDPQKEYKLFERLRREREGRITIFISHRLQTCRASDCILVMDHGRLVQSGSHEELMNDKSGIYAELHRLQNEDFQHI